MGRECTCSAFSMYEKFHTFTVYDMFFYLYTHTYTYTYTHTYTYIHTHTHTHTHTHIHTIQDENIGSPTNKRNKQIIIQKVSHTHTHTHTHTYTYTHTHTHLRNIVRHIIYHMHVQVIR